MLRYQVQAVFGAKAVAKVCVFGALALLLIPAALARGEEFKGENDMLRAVTPEERLTYWGLQYSLNKYQKRQFLSLPSKAQRDDWMRRYWLMNDPTPGTPENERKIEHDERVRIARSEFGMKKAPGWDARGEALIRWGWPAVRTSYPADIGFYRMVPPGEMWYYARLDMMILFQNFNLRGEYILAIEPQGASSRETLDKMQALSQFYQLQPYEKVYIQPNTSELAALQNFNPDRIDYIASPEVRAQVEVSSFHDLIEAEKMEKAKNRYFEYLEESPVIYSFELSPDLLDLYFDVTAFNAGYKAVRAEVNVEVPASRLVFERTGGVLGAEVELSVVVHDLEMNEVARASDVIHPTQSGGQVYQGPAFIPGQIAFALKPGYYRFGIQARDRGSGRTGVYRTTAELPPLFDRLSLSDVLFASSIRPAGESMKFVKGDLQVVPHPMHAYRKPFPLTFYFEIYGLDTDAEGMAFYAVDYRIVPVTKKRKGLTLEDVPTAISSRFETTGFGPTQAQQLEIATENLWKGSFRLIVTVLDRRTRQTVEKVANFSILE